RAFRAQAMVNCQHPQGTAGAPRPCRGDECEGKGVAAAGQGEGDRARAFAAQAAVEGFADRILEADVESSGGRR
ncbi:MAG: hypothetical protein ACXWKM_11330, partial [Phenylobacterium sp.]